MLPENFALVSTLIASLGSLHYLYLTAVGKVQPNKVTFFFWGVFPLIAFFAQRDEDVSGVIWITLSMGLLPFCILIVSYLNPKAYWKIKKRDFILATIAVFSMFLWYITKEPILAIVFALGADFFASLPTLIKSYKHPESENWKPYAINSFGFLIGVLSVQTWTFAEYSFVLYFFLLTTTITGILLYHKYYEKR